MDSEETIYTHGHDESVLRSHRWRTAANSAGYLVPHLRPDMTLLDVGCGPGTITADFAGLVTRVTAVEVSDEALDLARKEFTRRGIANVEAVVSDIHSLDFPDDTFDVVHAHQVLQHVGDPVEALREMARVCKPGGIVAARDADYGSFTWYPENPELDNWLSLYNDIARANGGEPDAGRRLRAWAHAAGLEDVVSTASVWCFSSDEDREWWGGSWADRVL
ncbi:MAG: methyltransferase domain-containing protein, partial [Nocardiaceae bacterium]|nr:methyltransferase domain-containing protein [Nocardiaceae bacterium]